MKDTTEINGKEYTLTEGEGGKLTLTPLIKQPPERTPEAGDVIERRGWTLIVDSSGGTTVIKSPNNCKTVGTNTGGYEYFGDSKNLGKFSEVYVRRDEHVKIADVIDVILSIEDDSGDNLFSCGGDETYFKGSGTAPLVAALAKLGITK